MSNRKPQDGGWCGTLENDEGKEQVATNMAVHARGVNTSTNKYARTFSDGNFHAEVNDKPSMTQS
jgi:hypothetical protein